jgi:hypothetical protein
MHVFEKKHGFCHKPQAVVRLGCSFVQFLSADFKKLTIKVDQLIEKYGAVRVVVDASKFVGWEDLKSAEQHFGFVKVHHIKIKKLAVDNSSCLAGVASDYGKNLSSS